MAMSFPRVTLFLALAIASALGTGEAAWISGQHGYDARPKTSCITDFAPESSMLVPTATAVASSAGSLTIDATSAASAATSSGGYLAIANKWRSAGGLHEFNHDNQLEDNALKTSTDSVGGLKHELNPGTMAQVLAPGNPGNFENVYVGGWLCEIPTLPGLNGVCATAAQGWDHSNGETEHAAILTSSAYTKIGCAISSSTNVWACDLA